MGGESHKLGKDYPEACRLFAKLYEQHYGEKPNVRAPRTVGELVAGWLLEHPGRWRADCVRRLAVAFPGLDLEAVKPRILEEYVGWLRRTGYRRNKIKHAFRAQSIKHYADHARQCLEWGIKRGYLQVKLELVSVPPGSSSPKDLPAKSIASMSKELERSGNKRAHGVFRFIAETGCRPGEARRLRWEQVDLEGGTCRLEPLEHKTGKKTGSARTIYLPPGARAVLLELEAHGGEGPIFKSRLGKPYTAAGLRSVLRRAGGLPYHLRHTFAQRFLDNGGDLAELATWLGHADLRMVKRYAQIRSQRLLAVAKRLPPVVPSNHPGSAAPASFDLEAEQPSGKAARPIRRGSATALRIRSA